MGPRTLIPACLATACILSAQGSLSPTQLSALTARGRELAQRVRFEEACRAHLTKAGLAAEGLSSPLISLGSERWFAWFLSPGEDPAHPVIQRSLVCPAGKPEALAPAESMSLPANLEPQAFLLAAAQRQLGPQAPEAFLITVTEPGGGASLYRLPRRNAAGAVMLGHDFRLGYQPGAARPFAFTRFHRNAFPLSTGADSAGKQVGFLHTHLELADPCETDVAAALLDGKLTVGVMTPKGVYTSAVDGTLSLGPLPEQASRPEGRGGPAATIQGTGLRAFAFDQSALDLEERWAVQPGPDADTCTLLCVHFDPELGFVAQLAGGFTLDRTGRAKALPLDPKLNTKLRLEADFSVSALPEGVRKDLGLPERPGFLAQARPSLETPELRVKRGAELNHLGESGRALAVLEPLHRSQPALPGLAFELGYAHNALRQPAKALPILTEAAKANPKDPWIARELAYSCLHTARYREAVEAYLRALPLVPEDNLQERSEQAMNLAQAYQQLGDTANRDAWMAKAKAWAPPGSPVAEHFARMEAAKGRKP